MEQTLQVVNFEQAKRLRQLGYDWKCRPYYDENGNIAYQDVNNDLRDGCFYAPTTALALKWLRDVEGARYIISFDEGDKLWNCFWFTPKLYLWQSTYFYDTYEEMESALLDAVLTELEKGDAHENA